MIMSINFEKNSLWYACQILGLVFASSSPRDGLEYSRESRGDLEGKTRGKIGL